MKHEVFWKNPGYKGHPTLKEDIACDYLIVGGGVTGVSLAYFLAKYKAGSVVLIEKNIIASGATGKAAGSLVIRGEKDLADIIRALGKKKAMQYWRELHKAMRLLRNIIKEERIDCDAQEQDTVYCGFRHKARNNLYKEFALERGVESTSQLLKGEELRNYCNTKLFSHAILSKNHGLSVNPLKLTQNLSKVAAKYGATFYEHTPLVRIENNQAKTSHARIKFNHLILALDAAHPAEEVRNLKSSIIITRPLTKEELQKTKLDKPKIFWDNKENYEYGKLTLDKRLLIGFGGVQVHKKHTKTDPHYPHIDKLKEFLKKLFPYLNLSIDYAWSGTFGVTDNYEPLIEQNGNRIAIAGAGTQPGCFMAAHFIAHKLTGRASSLDTLFVIKQERINFG